MSNLEVFIICHDQNIILEDEKNKKFSSILPCYRYLFVGNGNIDKIENNDKIIICRNLKNNIEHEKNLCSFTAWYSLANNELTTAKFVSVLEYDVDLKPDFYQKHIDIMERTNGIIGYIVFPLYSNIYLEATPWLSHSLKAVYNLDVKQIIIEYVNKTGKNSWCSTSNCTLSYDNLKNFVNWFLPISDVFKHDKLGAHVHERCIKIFGILNNIKTYYIKDVLTHLQKKSHGIEALV